MTKRRPLIMAAILLALAGLVWLGYLLANRRFEAASELENARLMVSAYENGQPVTGQLLVNGDCPKEELPSADGNFSCELIPNAEDKEPIYRLNSLGLFNYRDSSTSYFPLTAAASLEVEPLILEAGEKLILKIEISAEGTTVQRWNEETRTYQPFPLPAP